MQYFKKDAIVLIYYAVILYAGAVLYLGCVFNPSEIKMLAVFLLFIIAHYAEDF